MRFDQVMTTRASKLSARAEAEPLLTPLAPEWDGEPDPRCYVSYLERLAFQPCDHAGQA